MEQTKEQRQDEKSMIDIREGRRIMRKTIKSSSSLSYHSTGEEKNIIDILFVHGSCAGSVQYETMISSLCQLFPSKTLLRCHLFDALGCGDSKTGSFEWSKFSEHELAQDLEQVFLSMQQDRTRSSIRSSAEASSSSKPCHKCFIVAHSYGTSQVVKLLTKNSSTVTDDRRVDGIILIGGALRDGPCRNLLKGGGHVVFKLPVFLLKMMQPGMTKAFVQAAYHPNTDQSLKDTARIFSDKNEMAMVQAFYRQQQWSDAEDAQNMKVKALVLHGLEDNVVPVAAGEHLSKSIPGSKFVTVPNASHQVFEEHPEHVAKLIRQFIMEH